MLTPQEVSEHAFAKASFGGYNMAMVDEFLDLVTSDYAALYNENAVLKSKMKVLVDKVEEYRSTEEAMRKALMTAQRMADELVQEAERKKATILQDAEREVADKIAQIRQEVINEEYRLTAAQNATAAYVAKVKKLHQDNLDYLDNLDQLCPAPAQPEVDSVEETAQAIEDSVLRLLAAQEEEAAAQNAQNEEPAESDSPLEQTVEFPVSEPVLDVEEEQAEPEDADEPDEMEKTAVHRIDFGRLQFGRDYEIK